MANLPPSALQLRPAVTPMRFRLYVANVSIWNPRHFPFLLLTEDHKVSSVGEERRRSDPKQPKLPAAFKCNTVYGLSLGGRANLSCSSTAAAFRIWCRNRKMGAFAMTYFSCRLASVWSSLHLIEHTALGDDVGQVSKTDSSMWGGRQMLLGRLRADTCSV